MLCEPGVLPVGRSNDAQIIRLRRESQRFRRRHRW